MNYKRSERVGTLIKQEISNMLITELKDPGLGFITVTHVRLSDDLRHCKVYYSTLNDNGDKTEAQNALQRAHGRIKKQIGRRIKLRVMPEFLFIYDDSTQYADHIEELLKQIHERK